MPPKPSHNPDKRPLPDGWVEEYDEKRKKWYYRQLNPHRISYAHPCGTPLPASARDLSPDTDRHAALQRRPVAGASSYGETLYQLAKSSIVETSTVSPSKRTSVQTTSSTTRSPSIHSVEAVIPSSPPSTPFSTRSFSSFSSESSISSKDRQRPLYTSAQPQLEAASSRPPQYSPTDFKAPQTNDPVSFSSPSPPSRPSQVSEPLNAQPEPSIPGHGRPIQVQHNVHSHMRKVSSQSIYTGPSPPSPPSQMSGEVHGNFATTTTPSYSNGQQLYSPGVSNAGGAFNKPPANYNSNPSQNNGGYTPVQYGGTTYSQPAQGPDSASTSHPSSSQGGYTPVQYGVPNTSNKPPANHNSNPSQNNGGYTPVQYGMATYSQPAQGPTSASSHPFASQGGYTPVQYGIPNTSNRPPANHPNPSQAGYTPVQYSDTHAQPAHGVANGYSPTQYGPISSSNQGGYTPVQYGQNQSTFSNLSSSYGGSVGPPSMNGNAIKPPNVGYTPAQYGGSALGPTHNVNINVQPSSNNAGYTPGEAASYYGGYVPPSNPIFSYSSQYASGHPQIGGTAQYNTGSIPVQYGAQSSSNSSNPQGNAGNSESKPSTGDMLLGALKFGYKVYQEINDDNSQSSPNSNSNPGVDLNNFNAIINPDNNSGGGDNNYLDQLNQLTNALNGMTMSSDGSGGDSGNLAMQMAMNSMGGLGNDSVDINFNVNVTDSGNF